MPFERLAEARIREAIENGEFQNLKGAGRPLDHTEYFAAPEDLRAAHGVLKNSGFVPDEVSLLREIGELGKALAASRNADEREALTRRVEQARLRLNLMLERRKARPRR